MTLIDELTTIKELLTIVEDAYWRFNDLQAPDEDDETETSEQYTSIYDKLEDILASAQF